MYMYVYTYICVHYVYIMYIYIHVYTRTDPEEHHFIYSAYVARHSMVATKKSSRICI